MVLRWDPDQVVDRWRWQPLRVPLGNPNGTVQRALTPQWYEVVPFGLRSGFDHDVPSPPPAARRVLARTS